MTVKKRLQPLTRSIHSLLGKARKPYNAHKERPNDYYKTIWLDKQSCDGIEFIAKMDKTSQRKVVKQFMNDGISRWMAGKIKEYVALKKSYGGTVPYDKIPQVIKALRKLKKEKGIYIRKGIL